MLALAASQADWTRRAACAHRAASTNPAFEPTDDEIEAELNTMLGAPAAAAGARRRQAGGGCPPREEQSPLITMSL